jgi:hypothetical protein
VLHGIKDRGESPCGIHGADLHGNQIAGRRLGIATAERSQTERLGEHKDILVSALSFGSPPGFERAHDSPTYRFHVGFVGSPADRRVAAKQQTHALRLSSAHVNRVGSEPRRPLPSRALREFAAPLAPSSSQFNAGRPTVVFAKALA